MCLYKFDISECMIFNSFSYGILINIYFSQILLHSESPI